MTLDMTALGLTPVPSQENLDKAAELFNARNSELKAFSNSEDTVSGKAARDKILEDADLAASVTEFLAGISAQITDFMNEKPGASVHMRGSEVFAGLRKNVSDRANEDISDAVAEMTTPDADEAKSRDERIVSLKAEAAEIKQYVTGLAGFAAQFKMELNVPELDKISGPRLSTAPKVTRNPGRKPRISVDGVQLPEGTSFYSAVKQIRGELELSASTVQDFFTAKGWKFGKDECEYAFGSHILTVHPLAK